nr:MAG TPA: hypothetical protein [Caudoviricetes sp.]
MLYLSKMELLMFLRYKMKLTFTSQNVTILCL